MSKYSYHIAFNSSDYTEVFPNNSVKIIGDRDVDPFILRHGISEIKINKSLNSSVYDTLESWYTDSSKFGSDIYFKVNKDSSTEWEYIFGIKAGDIDFELKTYIVQPEIDDEYTKLLEAINFDITLTSPFGLILINENGDLSEYTQYLGYELRDIFEVTNGILYKINEVSGVTYTVKSSFLWNDNWPGGASAGTNNVVSSDYNYLNKMYLSADISILDFFDLLKMLQCFWYIDQNGEIRFEHVSYFISQIEDYQYDLGSDSQVDSNVFEYIEHEVYNLEKFKQVEESDTIAEDFDRALISYIPSRTRFRGLPKEITAAKFTNMSDDSTNNRNMLTVGVTNLVGGYIEGTGWQSFSSSGSNVDAEALFGAAYFETHKLDNIIIAYDITMDYDSVGDEDKLDMEGWSGSGGAGSPITLVQGSNTGNITVPTNGWLRFTTTDATDFEMTATYTNATRFRIPWETGELSAALKGNGYLSWANIQERFYRDYRISRIGDLNKVETTFNSTQYIKRQLPIRLHYPGSIDGLRGFKTDYGIAKIESYERDLDTDFVEFTLIYQEDE